MGREPNEPARTRLKELDTLVPGLNLGQLRQELARYLGG
jgi:hypothetical protein